MAVDVCDTFMQLSDLCLNPDYSTGSLIKAAPSCRTYCATIIQLRSPKATNDDIMASEKRLCIKINLILEPQMLFVNRQTIG
jgi:hypothetical protein